MTPEQLDLIAADGAAVKAAPDEFSTRFYARLFEVAPSTKALFEIDLRDQRGKLVDEFSFLVAAASDLGAFEARARALGLRHAGYGVSEEHYKWVRVALIDALQHVSGDRWTDGHAQAWSVLYALISETMLDGASGQLFVRS